MILIDANLLLYAKITNFAEHARARSWLDATLRGNHRVGIAWPTVQAFVRISTNPRVFPSPLSGDAAMNQVAKWLAMPGVWNPLPTDGHLETLSLLVRETKATGNLITDAELAALAIQHGLELQSTDGDFGRFRTLRWRNPIA